MLLATLATPGIAKAKAPAGFYGVTPAMMPTDTDLAGMARAHVGTVRVLFSWHEMQASPDAAYDFSATDRIVAQASHLGLRVLPNIYGAAAWARNCAGIEPRLCDRVDPLRSSAGRMGWPKFIAALATRYGPGGTLWSSGRAQEIVGGQPRAVPVRRWQLWNEANSALFLQPKPSAKIYRRLLASTARALRSVDPGAQIVLAGLFGTPAKGPAMTKFLRQLYRTKGAKKLFDGVAIHPYSPNLRGLVRQIELARAVMRRHKDARTRLFLTEFGWGSKPGGRASLFKGARGQKKLLGRSFKLLTRMRKRHRIELISWFSWRDLPTGTAGACLLCEHFGLLRSDSGAKPALTAFTRFTGGAP